ncbi:MAG: cytochrome c [Chryseolinea sp.]
MRLYQKILCFASLGAFLICSCREQSQGGHKSSVKFDQYFVKGEQLYQMNCSNCHQKNGRGLGRVYPPVDTSDFIDNKFQDVLCLLRYGRKGEIIVNGKMYNQAMPPPALTDLEIAEIATYLYNNWGRKRGIVEVTDVSQKMLNCIADSIQ